MASVQLNPVFEGISSRIGDLVFYRKNGKTFIRRRAVVNNPNSPAQQKRRTAFRDAVRAWQSLDGPGQSYWNNRAKKENRTGYNAFISSYMKEQAPETESEPAQESSAAQSGNPIKKRDRKEVSPAYKVADNQFMIPGKKRILPANSRAPGCSTRRY